LGGWGGWAGVNKSRILGTGRSQIFIQGFEQIVLDAHFASQRLTCLDFLPLLSDERGLDAGSLHCVGIVARSRQIEQGVRNNFILENTLAFS
jgi:hypothetical protein